MAQCKFRRPVTAVLAMSALILAACSDDPDVGLDTIAPASSTATLPAATSSTTAAETTVAEVTTSTVDASTTTTGDGPATPTTLALSDGPWQVVTSISEVTEPGLYYELSLPKLYAYFPTKVSPDDRVFWTMNEADRPIIEAYLNAQLTINQAMLTRPMDFNLEAWDLHFADGGAEMKEVVLLPRSASGLALNLDLGIVMRPWIIDDDRTETTAVVIDCVNNGSLLQYADGSNSPTATEGWALNSYRATMVLVDGQWKLNELLRWEDACTAFGPPYALL